MPGQGSSGFIIPAAIEVSIKGLSEVKAQVQSFTEGLTKKGATPARPVDPVTGEAASARRVAEDVGASVAKLRQSSREAREKATLPGLSQAEVQQWHQLADGFEKEAKRIIRATVELRREASKTQGKRGDVIPPLPPTPGAPEGQPLLWQRQAPQRPTGPGAPIAAFGEGGLEKDALASLVESYRKRANIARRIVENDQVILESGEKIKNVIKEQLRSEAWIAEQRLKYAQEAVGTREGTRKTAIQAEAIVAERVQKAQEGLAEQTQLRTNVGKGLLDTEAKLAGQRAQTKAKEADLAASNEKLIVANASITQSRLEQAARERLVRGGMPAKEAVGLQGPELIARANAMKRIADQQQRAQDIGAYRAAGGVDIAAKTKVLDSQLQREISIAETRLNLEQGNAQSIAEQKVLRDRLNREVAAQVRTQEDSVAIAKETAAAQRYRAEQAARVTLARAGEDPAALQGEALTARAAAVKKAQADRERVAAIQATTAAEIDATARRKTEESKLRVAIANRERQIIKDQIRSGDIKGGTFFQRVQTMTRPNANKLPEEYLTGPQFIAEKFQRTIGFAISGGAIAAVTAGITAMAQEATKLERAMVGVKAQLDSMGRGEQLNGIRSAIIGISNETGRAADEVALVEQAMLNLEGGDTEQALLDTSAAMKLMAITGEETAAGLSELTQIQRAFGESTEQVGDNVVDAAQKFGTTAGDAEKFLGKVSGVGTVAGRTSQELLALGGGLRTTFGGSLEATSDIINRTFDLIQNNIVQVTGILQANPATRQAAALIAKAVAEGDRAKALITLQQAVGQLDTGQRTALTQGLGTPQDAQFMAGVLRSVTDLSGAQDNANDSAGRLNATFSAMRDTIGAAFATIKNAMANIGDALLRSGLQDALRDVATLLGLIVGSVGAVARAFATLNAFTGGTIGKFVEMAVVFAAIVKAQNVLSRARQAGTERASEEAAATAADATAKEADAVATGGLATAEGGLATARTGVAAAQAGETVTRAGLILPPGVAGGGGGAGLGPSALALGMQGGIFSRLRTRISGAQFKTPFRGVPSGYAERFGAAEAEIAGLGAKFKGATLLDRSLAGGKFFQSAEADAAVAGTEGAVTGLMASPLLTGAIVVTGILAVKGKYDEMAQEVQAAGVSLEGDLAKATDENVRMVAGHQSDLIDKFQDFIFRQPSIEERGYGEQRLRETTGARQAMGAFVRQAPAPAEKAKQESQNYAIQTQKDLNLAWANWFDNNTKSAIGSILESTGPGREIGLETGVLEDTRKWWQNVLPSAGLFSFGKADAGIRTNLGAGPEQWASVREKLQKYGGDKPPPEISNMIEGINQAIQGKGPPPNLVAAQKLFETNKDLGGMIDAAGGDVRSVLNSLQDFGGRKFQKVEAIQSAYQSGAISEGQFRDSMQNTIDNLREIAANQPVGKYKDDLIRFADEQQKILTDMALKSALATEDIKNKIAAVTTLTPAREANRGHRKVMETVASVQQRVDDLPNQVAADLAERAETIKNIADPDQRLAAMNAPVELSSTTRVTRILDQFMKKGTLKDQVDKLAKITGKSSDEIMKTIAERAVESGRSVQDVARDYAKEQAAGYRNAKTIVGSVKAGEIESGLDSFAGAFEGIELPDLKEEVTDEAKAFNRIKVNADKRKSALKVTEARASRDRVKVAGLEANEAAASYQDALKASQIEGSGVTNEDVQAAEAKMIEGDKQRADAIFQRSQLFRNRAVILAGHDPAQQIVAQIGIAQAALTHAKEVGDPDAQEQAFQQLMQLQQQQADYMLEVARGGMAISQAQVAEDPLALAREQLKAAEFELAHAQGEADREQKEAQVIQAKRAVQNAISAGLTADAQLAITLANLRNDPVAAAVEAAREAQRQLDRAVAKGITDSTVLDPLTGALAEANKAAFLAPINKQIEDLDFLYNMEQLSLSEYVSGLEAQLSRLEVNSKEYRDLALKIFQLKKQGEQDLQFNLPTNLGLPTLYEARRVTQSGQLGMGYQDNRNVAVIVNVNGAQDPMTVTNQIVAAFQGATNSAPIYTPQVGVGA